MTHYSACCYFPSAKTIQLQRKGQSILSHRLSSGARGRGQCSGCLFIKERQSWSLLEVLLLFWGLFDSWDGGDAAPMGEMLVGVPLLGGPHPACSDPTGCLHNFSLNNLESRATCGRGMIHSQMQPGEGTAGMNRVSRSLCMKKISDGRSALLFCRGSCNKIPQERLKWKYSALKAELS